MPIPVTSALGSIRGVGLSSSIEETRFETCTVFWAPDYVVDEKKVEFCEVDDVWRSRRVPGMHIIACFPDRRAFISCMEIERHLDNLSEEVAKCMRSRLVSSVDIFGPRSF